MPLKSTKVLDDGPVYLTEDGVIRLKKHLEELKIRLPHLIEETMEAASQGDRSDNDGYKQSKMLLRRTQRQIWNIESQLKRVVIIRPGLNATGTVQLGSRVVLETESGDERVYEIVGPRETNPARERISQDSPLGKALLGHAKDETVTVQTVNGERKYKIIKVQ